MAETYTDMLEVNRWTLVKSVDPEPFLDFMRSHHVMCDADCETIQNPYVHPTRRARMGCFLDILRTKGPEGVSMFWRQLGWEYPHVYREIHRQDPEPPPSSYRQGAKSRISCNLDHLLKMGLDMSRLRSQQESLTVQLTDMEAMLKHQRCEIEDLERENQRLRQYERDNQQLQQRLHTLTNTNEEIKEENRQFLHEIRTLTLDLQKHRNNEAELQGQLDEVTQQIQEKSLELNRTKEEESDLRAKFERVRQQSLKFQTVTNRNPRPRLTETTRMQQDELKRQLDSLAEDNLAFETNNKKLCEQLKYMQVLLDDEKAERDQMHRRVCVLEHEKGSLETRLNTSLQKIDRYFKKIKELEAQKMKLEEERMHMQKKVWETSQLNERQFDQIHKMEARLDQMQQDYQKFRQEHRYCTPEEPWTTGRDRKPNLKARNDPNLMQRSGLSPHCSPSPGNDDPFKFFTPYIAGVARNDLPGGSNFTSPDGSDGDRPAARGTECARTDSTRVQVGSVRVRRQQSRDLLGDGDDDDFDDDDSDRFWVAQDKSPLASPKRSGRIFNDCRCSTISSCSSLSSSIFDQMDLVQDQTEPKGAVALSSDHSGNFFIRSNIQEAGDPRTQALAIAEGDILYVLETNEQQWLAVQVNKATGQLCHDQRGYIPSMDKTHLDTASGYFRRSPSCEDKRSLQRQGAVRGKGLHHQTSLVASYTRVVPMKANRPLPVVLVGLSSAMISCMEGVSLDWANIIADSRVESASQLFSTPDDKHNLIVWEARPKDHNSDVYKYIIIIVSLESEESVDTLRSILNNNDLHVEFIQEAERVKELEEFAHKAGLHSESLTIKPGEWTSESFWRAVRDMVNKVQRQVFWVEAAPKVAALK